VVRAAAVPAAHVLRGPAGDRRDDDHPRDRHRARVRAAVPGPRRDEPPARSAEGAGRGGPRSDRADRAGRDRSGEGRARPGLREGARAGEGAGRDRAPAGAQGRSRGRKRLPERSALPRARDLGRTLRGLPQPVRRGRREGPDFKDYNSRAGSVASCRPRRAAVHGPAKIDRG
jgi:hypothetical protein